MLNQIAICLILYMSPSVLFAQNANNPIELAIVVRVPTYTGKINFLSKQMHNPELSLQKKAKFQNSLNKTIEKRNDYFNLIKNGFNSYFKTCEVYYIPDTLYKEHLDGNSNVFINDSAEIQSLNTEGKKFIYILQGKDEYQLLLTDRDGNKLQKPWPYMKNTFLAAFKLLLDKEAYINNQIRYFDEKIAKLKPGTLQN